ncbi:ninein-like protein isoform X2 [Pogoniulus pusillus]|uniref:ninein-like protein isoform X2 n=1 Tax=Pogoniulus pusillus TaxID=488313 RepID=UPI0030B98481
MRGAHKSAQRPGGAQARLGVARGCGRGAPMRGAHKSAQRPGRAHARDFQAAIEAKDLLLQEALSHQVKLEADTEILQGKGVSLQGRLNHMMKENTQLQNRVTEMSGKLAASEELVLKLQKELSCVVKDKLGQEEPRSLQLQKQSECFAELVLEYERQCQVLWEQNGVLQRELERLLLQLQESKAERELPAAGVSSPDSSLPVCSSAGPLLPPSACTEASLAVEQLQEQLQDLKVQLETKVNYYEEKVELMRRNFERERKDSEESFKAELQKMQDQKRDLEETVAKYWAEIDSLKEQKCVWGLQLEERKHNLGNEKVEEQAEVAELRASIEKSQVEVSHLNIRMCQLGSEAAGHGAATHPATAQLQSQKPAELEWLQRAEMATKLEQHQQHAACWMEVQLLRQQLRASEEKLCEAKASLSLAQTQHALQLQQAEAWISNMVPKKQFELLQSSLREEQCKVQHLQEDLTLQVQQTHRQLLRTQAAVEQAEGLEQSLRSVEAVLAERVAQLKDAQAQLSRNKLLIEDLHEENRGFAVALQAAELKQKSTEEKNQLLEEQASALKQLIGTITPASLSG